MFPSLTMLNKAREAKSRSHRAPRKFVSWIRKGLARKASQAILVLLPGALRASWWRALPAAHRPDPDTFSCSFWVGAAGLAEPGLGFPLSSRAKR